MDTNKITLQQFINLLTPQNNTTTLTMLEELLNQYFGYNNIQEGIKKYGDAEEYIQTLIQTIIDENKFLTLMEEETGEVLYHINLHNYQPITIPQQHYIFVMD